MLHLPTDEGRGSRSARLSFPSLRRGGVLSALRRREIGECQDFFSDIYTALVPSNTFVNVQAVPQVLLRRFTPCGRFLVTVFENLTDVVVFRFEGGNWRANWKGELLPALAPPSRAFAPPQSNALLSEVDVPLIFGPVESSWFRYDSIARNTCNFERFFTRQYAVPVANPGEVLAPDFCLVSFHGRFLIFASFLSAPAPADDDEQPIPEPPPALRACPLQRKFTLYLVEMETGRVYDRYMLENDYVHLSGHPGVHMYRNLLCILSLRHQTLYIVRVQESVGRFVHERKIGPVCSEDDEHVALRAGNPVGPGVGVVPDLEAVVGNGEDDKHVALRVGNPVERGVGIIPDLETGLGNGKRAEGLFTGLMQRMLAYIFRKFQREGHERNFFRVMAQFSMLVMLKAQLLDDDHILIQLGSDEGGRAPDVEKQTYFFLVYCISTTRILNLYENKSVELLQIFESYQDMFIGDPAVARTVRKSATAASLAAQLRTENRSIAIKKVRRALSCLPVPAQMRNTSPYMDRRLYSYDMERLDMARKPIMVKFTSVRTGSIRLRLAAGRPALSEHMRLTRAPAEEWVRQANLETKAAANSHISFLFHPIYPFIISTVTGPGLTKAMSFHVMGHT